MTIKTIEDLMSFSPLRIVQRELVDARMAGHLIPRLDRNAEVFAAPWLVDLHRTPPLGEAAEIAAYVISDIVVSGTGQIWIDEHLVTSPEVMPLYVRNLLKVDDGGCPSLAHDCQLPVRTISYPCLVAIGHGTRVYGHFLIEVLFRILVAQAAFPDFEYKVLLDRSTPPWLIYILSAHLKISLDSMEFFDPARERIHLEKAIVSGRVWRDHYFHPAANWLLLGMRRTLPVKPNEPKVPRLFVTRRQYTNVTSFRRRCENEDELVTLATKNYGFKVVAPESLEWLEQISLFESAEVIVGEAGSALHNGLFSMPGSRLGSVGFINFEQSLIGALRRQKTIYLNKDFQLTESFRIDIDTFDRFLQILCEAE